MNPLLTHLAPLLVDPQTTELLAKGGFLKGIGKLLLFGLVILIVIGAVIGFTVGRRARRR